MFKWVFTLFKKRDDVYEDIIAGLEKKIMLLKAEKHEKTAELIDKEKDLENYDTQIRNLKDQLADLAKTKELEIREMEQAKQLQIEELEATRKMEDEKIKHLVKIKEGSLELAHKKKVVKVQEEANKKIQLVRDEYAKKSEKALKDQLERLEGQYSEVLDRLPNISARMGGRIDAVDNPKAKKKKG